MKSAKEVAAKIEGIKLAKQVLLNSPQSLWTAQTDLLDAEIAKLGEQINV